MLAGHAVRLLRLEMSLQLRARLVDLTLAYSRFVYYTAVTVLRLPYRTQALWTVDSSVVRLVRIERYPIRAGCTCLLRKIDAFLLLTPEMTRTPK